MLYYLSNTNRIFKQYYSSSPFISFVHKIKFSFNNCIISKVYLAFDFSKSSKHFIASSKAVLAIVQASSFNPLIS